MYNGLDSFFDDLLGNDYARPVRTKQPKVSILEDSKGYSFEVSVPGYKMEDLSVKIDKKVLHIATSRAYNKKFEEKAKTSPVSSTNGVTEKPLSSYKEFSQGTEFSRSFELSKFVDLNTITAKLSKGILYIRLLKVEDAQPHTIEIS